MSSGCSSPSSISSPEDLCQVCGQNAHGVHFGALTCRACAAFFRRGDKHLEKKCRLLNGKCGVFGNGRFYCKRCRIERCIEVGMKPDVSDCERSNEITIKSTDKTRKRRRRDLIGNSEKIPPTMASFLGRPHLLLQFEPDLSPPIRATIDLNYFINQASYIFEKTENDPEKYAGMSNLGKMAFGLNKLRHFDSDVVSNVPRIAKDETVSFWECDFLMVADWLTYCDEFQKLILTDKMKILKCMWLLWNRLEKLSRTAELRLSKKCDNSTVMISKDKGYNVKTVVMDVSWFSKYDSSELTYYMSSYQRELHEKIINSFQEIKPTSTEQAFMLSQISFDFAGKLFQGNILESVEKMQTILSDDLHNYYVTELNMPNYIGRLAKLLKLNNIIKQDVMEQTERKKLGCLFDIFSIDFTHPEIFMFKTIE